MQLGATWRQRHVHTSFPGIPTRLITGNVRQQPEVVQPSSPVQQRNHQFASPNSWAGPSGGSAESSAPGKPAASGKNDFDFDVPDINSRYLFELTLFVLISVTFSTA